MGLPRIIGSELGTAHILSPGVCWQDCPVANPQKKPNTGAQSVLRHKPDIGSSLKSSAEKWGQKETLREGQLKKHT